MAHIVDERGASTVVTGGPTGSAAQQPYVDWPAVLGGAVVAWALAFLFLAFASGIGLTMTGSPWRDGMSTAWFLAAAAIWFIWTQVSSVMAGGYIAGRLRRRINDATEHEVDIRDGAHGLLVWAVSALVGAVLALGLVAGGAKVVTGALAPTVNTTGDILDDRGMNYVVDRLFRTVAGSDAAIAASPRAEMEREEVRRIIAAAGRSGTLAEVDRSYIAQTLAGIPGITPEEAISRVDGFLVLHLTEARAEAEKARKTGIVVAFLTAATFLVSALAGWWAASTGGRHRDNNLDLTRWFRVR
ncbi:MAG: hypothetical protein WD767_09400 [Alphaproteobacteria bacterium]